MTADLPKLRIGCGIVWQTVDVKTELGAYPLVRCVPELLCPTCQHNLDALKKNAAAHHKKTKILINTSHAQIVAVTARDAVLKLAGLAIKDLENKQKED